MTVTVTPAAQRKLQELSPAQDPVLRVTVAPGGCAGMSYSAAVVPEPAEADITVLSLDTVTIVTDSFSRFFLDGLIIDYSSDLIKPGFHLSNAYASESCGCGSSFAL